MANKRQLECPGDSDEPKAKRGAFGGCSSTEELDFKTLQFQNVKLYSALQSKNAEESEWLAQIESLKANKTAVETALSLINRHWDQLIDNLKVVLVRLETKGEEETEVEEDEKKTSFLRLLKDSEFQDIKENVTNRVNASRETFAKVVDAIINEKSTHATLAKKIDESSSVDEAIKAFVAKLQKENESLNSQMTLLQAKHDLFLNEKSTLEDKVDEQEDRIADLQDSYETGKWELQKAKTREQKLTKKVNECMNKINNGTFVAESNQPSSGGEGSSKNGDKKNSTEEWQLLAEGRLAELEELKQSTMEALKEVEKLKHELQHPSEATVYDSSHYKNLKSQFSVLFHESAHMKSVLDEARQFHTVTRTQLTDLLDKVRKESFLDQDKLKNELTISEQNYLKTRSKLELNARDLEQKNETNAQVGPVNREMRHLINSLKKQNQQLKTEGQRFKKKFSDLKTEFNKYVNDPTRSIEAAEAAAAAAAAVAVAADPADKSPVTDIKMEKMEAGDDAAADLAKKEIKEDLGDDVNEKAVVEKDELQTKLNELKSDLEKERSMSESFKRMLAMYEELPKEQREKVEVMAHENELEARTKALDAEVSELKPQLASSQQQLRSAEEKHARLTRELADVRSKLYEEKNKNGGGKADIESLRKNKALEETVADLRRNLAATKQEEEALLKEMDVTGTAYEQMQEQNIRLVQQLREKDDANFKLISEKVKSDQIYKIMQEEKTVLQKHRISLTSQVEAQNLVVRKLEEKERYMHSTIVNLDKEANLRLVVSEVNKKKALESTQHHEDAKRMIEKYLQQIEMLEKTIDKKVESLEEERFKISRIQEDQTKLRRKLEKHKKTAGLYTADEVLMEEIKEYKTKLRCPCCNVNNKDAVLTKCYHVFCIACIQKRYETRQRKCPKCNAGFGGNDYHRIYIE